MDLMLRDGDYVPDGRGGFCRVEGAQEVLQRALWKLSIRRGSFPLLPRLGSRLYLLPRERPSARPALARQYAAEALEDEEGLTVTGVEWRGGEDGRAEAVVSLEWRGEALRADVTV